MKKVAIVGIQGLPANYGGFESLVENIIGENSSNNILYTVFCSKPDMGGDKLKEYKGAKLEYIDSPSHGINSLRYYTKSLQKVTKGYDDILILGMGGGLYLPIFKMKSKTKVIINVDGIERKRAKFNRAGKFLLYILERLSVKFADQLISDNEGIRQFLLNLYNKDSVMIAYGGDHVKRCVSREEQGKTLEKFGLVKENYAITVCRIEPENNCHVILEAFEKSKENLVFIGNWNRSKYGRNLKTKYSTMSNIKILDPIYDLDTLYSLRGNAKYYIHGHSVGGTNPSLVEAMFFGKPIFCFDVIFNRETTFNKAYYWKNVEELIALIQRMNLNGEIMSVLAEKHYTWKQIAKEYENLY